jgi:hypothetical protein
MRCITEMASDCITDAPNFIKIGLVIEAILGYYLDNLIGCCIDNTNKTAVINTPLR